MTAERIRSRLEAEGWSASFILAIITYRIVTATTRPKNKDFEQPGRFAQRLRKKISAIRHILGDEETDFVLSNMDAIVSWEITLSLDPNPEPEPSFKKGMGGYVYRTLRQVIEQKEE